jgi:hypothetical protein
MSADTLGKRSIRSSHRQRAAEGKGIGLSIVRRLASDLAGQSR